MAVISLNEMEIFFTSSEKIVRIFFLEYIHEATALYKATCTLFIANENIGVERFNRFIAMVMFYKSPISVDFNFQGKRTSHCDVSTHLQKLRHLTGAREGGGGNSTLILVQVCRRDFSNPPIYICTADFRNIYLIMYDLFTFAGAHWPSG